MIELKVKIPEELESELKQLPDIELSIFLTNLLRKKLSRAIEFKQIVSKSKLTEEQAEELADEISMSLAKRYDKLYSKFSKK